MYHKAVDESNFIDLLKKKDERALDYVIEKYGGLIKAVVQKHLFEFPDKCGECMDDILLTVWYQIDHFDREKNTFTGWLAAVCKYKAIDYKRKYHRQAMELPLSEKEPGLQGNPEDSLILEVNEEMQTLLEPLSQEDRVLFWDCYVREKSVHTIAQERRVNVSVLYNRISRGKKKIRQVMEVHQ